MIAVTYSAVDAVMIFLLAVALGWAIGRSSRG
jgi:hypothetical protein